MQISIFDWNGNLMEEIKKDCAHFGFTAEHIPGGVMGFQVFKIEGKGVKAFLEFYELEADH
jgi:hypothetical protein